MSVLFYSFNNKLKITQQSLYLPAHIEDYVLLENMDLDRSFTYTYGHHKMVSFSTEIEGIIFHMSLNVFTVNLIMNL